MRILLAKPVTYTVDFNTAEEEDLHKYVTFLSRLILCRILNKLYAAMLTRNNFLPRIYVPLSFTAFQSGTVHGLAFWFDVAFFGST